MRWSPPSHRPSGAPPLRSWQELGSQRAFAARRSTRRHWGAASADQAGMDLANRLGHARQEPPEQLGELVDACLVRHLGLLRSGMTSYPPGRWRPHFSGFGDSVPQFVPGRTQDRLGSTAGFGLILAVPLREDRHLCQARQASTTLTTPPLHSRTAAVADVASAEHAKIDRRLPSGLEALLDALPLYHHDPRHIRGRRRRGKSAASAGRPWPG